MRAAFGSAGLTILTMPLLPLSSRLQWTSKTALALWATHCTAQPRMSAVCMQSGETGGFTINAVLTGQPGHVTVRVRDKFGPEGSSQLASASLDVTLCAAPTTAQVGPSLAPALGRCFCKLYT